MTCERCVEIFLKAVKLKSVMFDKNLMLKIYLVKTYGYTVYLYWYICQIF